MKETQVYSIRKNKVVGACSVLLATMAFAVLLQGKVSADEVTVPQGSPIVALSEQKDNSTVGYEVANVEQPVSAAMPRDSREGQPLTEGTGFRSADSQIISEATTVEPTQTVENTTQGTVKVSSNDGYNKTSSFELTTHLTAPAKAGDKIEYLFTNTNPSILNDKPIVTQDGASIGRFAVKTLKDNVNATVNPSVQGRENLDVIAQQYLLTANFTKAVESLADVTYKFSVNNERSGVLVSDREKDYLVNVKTASGVVAETTTKVPKQVGVDQKDLAYATDDVNGVLQKDGTYGEFNVGSSLVIPSEKKLKAGDTITIEALKNVSFDVDKSSVGKELIMSANRAVYADTAKNSHGTYLYDKGTLKLKVKEIAANKAVFEVLEDNQETDRVFFIGIPSTVLGIEGASGNSIPFETKITVSGSQELTGADSANIIVTGGNVSAEAIGKGKLLVKYLTDDNRTLEVMPVTEAKIGTDYTTQAKKFKDWELKTTPSNATGKYAKGTVEVAYIYTAAKGSVNVEYRDLAGKEIQASVVDSKDLKVGTEYDTKDHKPEMIKAADGKVYKFVKLGEKSAAEVGKVTEGTQTVVYLYDEVKGSVVVRYVDESGKEIAEQVVDTKDSSVGTEYDTTDHKPNKIMKDGKEYDFVKVAEDSAAEKGTVKEGETKVTYVYKEVVKPVETPKEDPKQPEQPKPEEPGKPQPQPSLPNTGTASSVLGFVGTGILSMLGLVGLKRKKEAE